MYIEFALLPQRTCGGYVVDVHELGSMSYCSIFSGLQDGSVRFFLESLFFMTEVCLIIVWGPTLLACAYFS